MKHPLLCCAALVLGLGAGGSALARPPAMAAPDTSMCGHNQQDRTACLREAAAARQAARTGQLTGAADYRANALARYSLHKAPDERAACEARILGTGQTMVEGSVMGGGLIRETITPVPAGPR